MINKEYIKRICDLTCSKSDVEIPLKDIEYDLDNPFKKYYDVDIIISAIKKYVAKEWNAKMLSYWGTTYNAILTGGFNDEVNNDLTSLEKFLVKYLSMDLDVLLLIDHKQSKQDIQEQIMDITQHFYIFDHILETIDEWQGFYAIINDYELFSLNQYEVLINNVQKEFIIMSGDISIDATEYEALKNLSRQDFIDTIEEMKANKYDLLPCCEFSFFTDIR